MKNTAISIMGLVAVFAVVYELDRWVRLVLRQARENFNISPYFWFLSIANLVLAASILFLLNND